MKKGKTEKINGFRTSKIVYGTVDSKEFKSLYLNIQTWVEPKKDSENWTRVVLNMSRSIKHTVYHKLDKTMFDDKFIVDLDLRTSGLHLKKKSFMNLEVNFYVIEENLDFKSRQIKDTLLKITNKIYKDNFYDNNYFKFYLTKKIKSVKDTLQIDNV
jgi:hypothetical protein